MVAPLVLMLLPLLWLQGTQADYAQALALHNAARHTVGCSPLSWSPKLAAEAQGYADQLARRSRLEHATDLVDCGENLYWCSNSPISPASDASTHWIAESALYTHSPRWARNFSEVGHYTQVVWSKTTQVGIGVAKGKDGSTYVVARYFPAGNYTNLLPY